MNVIIKLVGCAIVSYYCQQTGRPAIEEFNELVDKAVKSERV